MLPGSVGSRWMPRKMAGIAMITIDVSIVAIIMLSVVFERATHLYLPPSASGSAAPTARTLARLRILPGSAAAGAAQAGRFRPGAARRQARAGRDRWP